MKRFRTVTPFSFFSCLSLCVYHFGTKCASGPKPKTLPFYWIPILRCVVLAPKNLPFTKVYHFSRLPFYQEGTVSWFSKNNDLLREAPMLLECRKSDCVRPSVLVRPEVIENLRAAYRGWTHAFPYAGFELLIFQDFKEAKKRPS